MQTKIIPCDDKFHCPYCGHCEGHRAGDYLTQVRPLGTTFLYSHTCFSCSEGFSICKNDDQTVTLTFDENLVKPKPIEATEQFCKDFRELITARTKLIIKEFLGRDTLTEVVRFNELESEFNKKYFAELGD